MAMRDSPPAVIQVIRGEAQSVAAPWVLLRMVITETIHVCIEAWAADHPRRVILELSVPAMDRDVADTITTFLVEGPARENVLSLRHGESLPIKACPDQRSVQGACVQDRHGQVAVEVIGGPADRDNRRTVHRGNSDGQFGVASRAKAERSLPGNAGEGRIDVRLRDHLSVEPDLADSLRPGHHHMMPPALAQLRLVG